MLLCIGHALLGGAVVSFNLFRFAVAEIVDLAQQSKAISITLGSGLVAALVAPEVFRLSRGVVEVTLLAGPYLALSFLAFLGSLPLLFSRFASPVPKVKPVVKRASRKKLLHRPKIIWAIVCGAGSAAGMTLLMTATPLSMVGHGFSDMQAGDVISWHVVAMFAPSFVTGSIINKIGANRVVIIGALFLALSGAIAITGLQLMNFYVALLLLGVGWNFLFVGGTTLLTECYEESEKSRIQAANDFIVFSTVSVTALSSGALHHHLGWSFVNLCVIPFILLCGWSAFWLAKQRNNTSVLKTSN